MRRVLLVEDDNTMRAFLKAALVAKGWGVTDLHQPGDQEFGEPMTPTDAIHFILLDADLTDREFESRFLSLRSKYPEVPILALTIGEGVLTKRDLLRLGVSDFLPKPFAFAELLQRLERLKETASTELVLSQRRSLRVDLIRKEILMGDKKIIVSESEWNCLRVLCERVGKVVDEQTLSGLTSRDPGPEALLRAKLLVWNLRQKLEEDPVQPQVIKTVPGVGYRLEISV